MLKIHTQSSKVYHVLPEWARGQGSGVGTGNIVGASGAILTGGPVYYIREAFKGNGGKLLAGFFAIAVILAMGFFGCMVQSNSIGSTFQTAFGTVFGAQLGSAFVAIALFFFAFSTILGWNMFGKTNAEYLFGEKGAKVYTLISLVFIFLGTAAKSDLVWELSDMFNQLMVLPNVVGLIGCSALVVSLTKFSKK